MIVLTILLMALSAGITLALIITGILMAVPELAIFLLLLLLDIAFLKRVFFGKKDK